MAIIRSKDVGKMSDNERETKLSELNLELIKANVSANKANAKTKEIKRAIARLKTFQGQKNSLDTSKTKNSRSLKVNKSAKEELKKK